MCPNDSASRTAIDQRMARWQRLAAELGAVIGDCGFDMLLARSIHLTQAQFPWLSTSVEPGFSSLRADLQQQTPALADAANAALLAALTDTLAQLIGRSLASAILLSAARAPS